MTDTPLPQNVYRLAQKELDAIPGSPWVYWISQNLRVIFDTDSTLSTATNWKRGITTADNFRFIRYWWESGKKNIGFGLGSVNDTLLSHLKWFPCVKGGSQRKWYGNLDFCLNYGENGKEIKAWAAPLYGNSGWSRIIKSPDCYFKEGTSYSSVTSGSFSLRLMPKGFIFDQASNAIFPEKIDKDLLLGISNSSFVLWCLKLNPTVNITKEDFERIPLPNKSSYEIKNNVRRAIRASMKSSLASEITFIFVTPAKWQLGIEYLDQISAYLQKLESKIDEDVYQLYDISTSDRAILEAELATAILNITEEELAENKDEQAEPTESAYTLTLQDMAVYWISYVVGIVFGRFKPGLPEELGSAVYRQEDFTAGTLLPPDKVEFDELVGSSDHFAYVDEQGGRHVFSAQVEKALQSLALPDGIAVFDEGHPRDLPTLVEKALNLMLGEQAAQEVIREATGGDSTTSLRASLRKFLEKEFFTGWHMKWYRKRPVYWPVQSSKRSYGFVLFHEMINRQTFYAIQRDPYLDTKRNAVALKMADIQAALKSASGAARKRLEKELDDQRKLSEELAEFAKELEAITLGGYEPEPDWIDDGVILRMAPLWKVIPIWKSEPKKYWEKLAAGEFDWSHIAMKYWPDRVRQKCKTNKSFAIAHGHEEWYEG